MPLRRPLILGTICAFELVYIRDNDVRSNSSISGTTMCVRTRPFRGLRCALELVHIGECDVVANLTIDVVVVLLCVSCVELHGNYRGITVEQPWSGGVTMLVDM